MVLRNKTGIAIGGVVWEFTFIVSDTIGRLLPGNGEMPAGIIVAIIGAPYFLYLLIKTSDSL